MSEIRQATRRRPILTGGGKFPAAILRPPFFQAGADSALNYGGIGAVIGHEIGHGFDDQGSQYDGKGNLRDWWTKEDHEKFATRTKMLIDQYSGFEPAQSDLTTYRFPYLCNRVGGSRARFLRPVDCT